jgi:hypothetical protein
MGTGAGGPSVLALLFAVCAPLRLQAEELGEWGTRGSGRAVLWASGEPGERRAVSARRGMD